MKIGSLVECVNASNIYDSKKLIKGGVYTIREVREAGVLLEEVVNGICLATGREWGYLFERFREVEFPPSLEAEIEESLNRVLVEK